MESAFGVDHGDISKKFRLPGKKPKKNQFAAHTSSGEDPFRQGRIGKKPGGTGNRAALSPAESAARIGYRRSENPFA